MATTKFQVTTIESGDTSTIDFGTTVINASVAVQGYYVSYDGSDHHVKTLNVHASIRGISGSSVSVAATCIMEDSSDHKVKGNVDVLVIAECES